MSALAYDVTKAAFVDVLKRKQLDHRPNFSEHSESDDAAEFEVVQAFSILDVNGNIHRHHPGQTFFAAQFGWVPPTPEEGLADAIRSLGRSVSEAKLTTDQVAEIRAILDSAKPKRSHRRSQWQILKGKPIL